MATPFSAEPKLVNELFARDVSYVIPEYQRPYSWQCLGKSDKNNQVNVMWNDLFDYYSGHKEKSSDYFFGSIVLIDYKTQQYDVIDGQQRLTTLILLFVAIKSFLKEASQSLPESDACAKDIKSFVDGATGFIDEIIYNKKLIGVNLVQKKLKIEKNSGFEYDSIFSEVVEGKNKISENLVSNARQEQLQVINRYLSNRDFLQKKIKEAFTTNGNFEIKDVESLNSFIDFLKNRVSMVRILATNFDVAYHVFEILNNRGLPLSNKDLFRNFIIKEFDFLKKSDPDKYQSIDSNEKWNELEKYYEVSDDFLGRWVESYTGGQQKSSAFNDLKEIFNSYKPQLFKSKIELLHEDIKRDLAYYSSITNSSVEDPIIKSKISFIVNGPNVRYGLNFLLALAKSNKGFNANREKLIDLITQYECYLISSLLINRFSSGPVYKAIASLIENKMDDAMSALSQHYNKKELKNAIDDNILDNESASLLIAKFVWLNEALSTNDQVSQTLFYDKTTLEHIIPQTPDKKTNWVTDFSTKFKNDYTYRLGNMTLLTNRLNSSARNYDFSVKKIAYGRTKLPTTVELASLNLIDEYFITKRHNKIIKTLYEDLKL